MPSARQALPQLPPAKFGQSLSGYVREHLDAIETLLESGLKYDSVVLSLINSGIDGATYGALDSALFRARRRRKARPGRPAAPPQTSQPARPQPAALPPDEPAKIPPRPDGKGVRLTPTADLKPDDLI